MSLTGMRQMNQMESVCNKPTNGIIVEDVGELSRDEGMARDVTTLTSRILMFGVGSAFGWLHNRS
jgi:hypothetical protein